MAQTQLAVAMSPLTWEPRLRFRSLSRTRAEIVEPLLLSSSHSFLAPQKTPSPRIAFANRSVPDDPAQGSNQP